VHRLDKDASGVLLLARTKEMASILSRQFQESEKYLKKIVISINNILVFSHVIARF
jgi:23S rRNA-/tRNA-specific pseudouridylate synthase